MRVIAPSRLHLGLLNVNSATETTRQFGGVGLMIDAPGIRLQAIPAATWTAEGPLADRVLSFAPLIAANLVDKYPAAVVQPQQFVVEEAPREHVGLGAGTQLGLAVAAILTESAGLSGLAATELAQLAGRGARSAVGIHGFARGGFLVEGGKHGPGISPLIARIPFPEQWRVVLVIPPGETGLHGAAEQKVFKELAQRVAADSKSDALCRIVLLGMLPALVEEDIDGFGESVHEFNVRSGEVFAPSQGGNFAGGGVREVVDFVRQQGVQGVGQSSWGPAVFAFTVDVEQADHLACRIRQNFGFTTEHVLVTGACNGGAAVVR